MWTDEIWTDIFPMHSIGAQQAGSHKLQQNSNLLDACWSLFEHIIRMASALSKLEPFREFIAAERRKKTTYRRIAELLAEKGMEVDYSTIHAFVKVRSKPSRKVITMWEPRGTNTAASEQISNPPAEKPRTGAALKTQPERPGQLEAIRRFKQAKPTKRSSGKGLPSFRENAPLERLSDDEARRLRESL